MPWAFGQGGLARDIFWMHRDKVRGVLSHGQPVREHLFRAQTGKPRVLPCVNLCNLFFRTVERRLQGLTDNLFASAHCASGVGASVDFLKLRRARLRAFSDPGHDREGARSWSVRKSAVASSWRFAHRPVLQRLAIPSPRRFWSQLCRQLFSQQFLRVLVLALRDCFDRSAERSMKQLATEQSCLGFFT